METPDITLSEELLRKLPKDGSGLNKVVRPSLTYWQDAWIRLRKNKVAVASLIVLIIYIGMAIFAPMLSKYSYSANNAKAMNLTPNAEHWFGTDQAGRDLWTRNWRGARVSLFIGFVVVVINNIIGCVIGGISGYFGGKIDMVIMRVIDVLYGIPMIILAILLMTVM
ncbi:MAG: ABC transporter permease, partial [Clostridiales bacterium]|nr:ABC transporter permease [Clostridiales bacterium]